jgi:beta-alanine--pyruvate transaminase
MRHNLKIMLFSRLYFNYDYTMTQTPSNRPALEHFWMPFTAQRQFREAPRIFSAAKGMYYTSDDGRQVLDGTAGLWCVNVGHGRSEIAQAVALQLETLDFGPTFQMGHTAAFTFAERLAKIAPFGLERIFFTNSGSESVESALKIALAYHRARGEGQRTRFIGREKGYHGVNFGGMSVGGLLGVRRTYGPLLPGVDHLRHTLDIKRNAFSRGLPAHGLELAEDLERLVNLHGGETIAAVIVEPVQGSAGVIPPPAGYLERLREICTQNGILLIMDEVITGFGRLGTPFGCQYFNVKPDMITTAKGITNGVVPMGAVFVDPAVQAAMMQGPAHIQDLAHGYTYSGHPVACAAGLAVLDIYERENLLTRVTSLAAYWEKALHSLQGEPHVIDIRNIGLMGAVELSPRAGAPTQRAYDVFVDCFNQGALVRSNGETIALSPPLIVSEAEIDALVDMLRIAIRRVA